MTFFEHMERVKASRPVYSAPVFAHKCNYLTFCSYAFIGRNFHQVMVGTNIFERKSSMKRPQKVLQGSVHNLTLLELDKKLVLRSY